MEVVDNKQERVLKLLKHAGDVIAKLLHLSNKLVTPTRGLAQLEAVLLELSPHELHCYPPS